MNEIQYGTFIFVLLIDYFIECKDSLMVRSKNKISFIYFKQRIYHNNKYIQIPKEIKIDYNLIHHYRMRFNMKNLVVKTIF